MDRLLDDAADGFYAAGLDVEDVALVVFDEVALAVVEVGLDVAGEGEGLGGGRLWGSWGFG